MLKTFLSPEIEVVICTYRRFKWLTRCLAALCEQTIDTSRFRVIVVDNSLQPLESSTFQATLPKNICIEYIVTEKSGASYARNVGIAHCTAPYIGFLDDDAIAEPDWLAVILETFLTHPAAGVIGGKAVPIWECSKPEWIKNELLHKLSVLDWGDVPFCFVEKYWLISANSAYRRDILSICGGFSEHLGRVGAMLFAHEEYQLNKNIVFLGYEMWYIPTMKVQHAVQKERCTQEWLYRDSAFGSASMFIAEHTVDVDKINFNEFSNLIASCIDENILSNDPNYNDISETCLRLAESSWQICSQYFAEDNCVLKSASSLFPVLYIVTPCLNAAATIDQTILSVVSQQGDFAIRYHIQDGGSTDGTLEKLRAWKDLLDDPSRKATLIVCKNIIFSYSTGVDKGNYHAIQTAFDNLAIPSAAIMAWINADDYYHQNEFLLAYNVLSLKNSVLWLTGDICNVENSVLSHFHYAFATTLIAQGCNDGINLNTIQQEGTFFKNFLWDTAGGFNLDLHLAADWDLWRRFAQLAPCGVVEYPLATFRQRKGQLSGEDGGKRYFEEINSIISASQRKQYVADYYKNDKNLLLMHCLEVEKDAYVLNTYPVHLLKIVEQDKYVLCRGIADSLQNLSATDQGDSGLTPVGPYTCEQAHFEKTSWIDAKCLHHFYLHSPKCLQKLLTSIKYAIIMRIIGFWKTYRNMRIIDRSKLFFEHYYRATNPDVEQTGVNPLRHYVVYGEKEGRKPNPYFDPNFYMNENVDVRRLGTAPLVHYILHGYKENRATSTLFNTKQYLIYNEDVCKVGMNPLLHYLLHGIPEGRKQL